MGRCGRLAVSAPRESIILRLRLLLLLYRCPSLRSLRKKSLCSSKQGDGELDGGEEEDEDTLPPWVQDQRELLEVADQQMGPFHLCFLRSCTRWIPVALPPPHELTKRVAKSILDEFNPCDFCCRISPMDYSLLEANRT